MMGPCIVQNSIKNDLYESLKLLRKIKTKKDARKVERQVDNREITIILRENLNLYIQDIEGCTKRKMTLKQRDLITDYVNNNRIFRQEPSSDNKGRRAFEKKRARLRQEWEKETGQEWPKYDKNVYDGKGRVIRLKGQPYDAHHIVEISYGGPNVWYNLFPAKHPDEHQRGIHRENSIASQIFVDENSKSKMATNGSVEVLDEPDNRTVDKKEKNKKKKKKKRKLVLKK